jgi:phosphoserine phosphatase RsbU/P
VRFLPKTTYSWLALVFVALLAADLALQWFGTALGLAGLLTFALIVIGAVLGIQILRRSVREAIWRLRNRLIVTYVFIAVVPIALIVALAAVGTWIVSGQIAVYLVSSELERRAGGLEGPARFLTRTRAGERAALLMQMAPLIEEGLPGFEVVGNGDEILHYPPGNTLTLPASDGRNHTGYLRKDGRFYCFSLARTERSTVLLMAPIDAVLLGKLVPGIGVVNLNRRGENLNRREVAGKIPPARNFLDVQTVWDGEVAFLPWDQPWSDPKSGQIASLAVLTRPSAVLTVLFDPQGENAQDALVAFAVIAGLLLLVWVLSFVIGVQLTRTITGSVHGLYEGTTKIATGDFGYRIPVQGKDQLAALGTSFNNMTTQLQSLLKVAKEKERLQSEVEIASEVQNQLFPRSAPSMRTIELFGACQPARTVSGDYYDYLRLPDGNLAVAIGDVAGKGISAALLMASIQSIMRTQLAAGGDSGVFSASRLVAQLNRQLYASTSPEKYATFFFGVYDENSRLLTYTNAGHLPPLLLHDGAVSLLEVTGTVVGLFPSIAYQEQSVRIESGDLLIAYTDGITEPENDYGEEFGADRLAEVALRNQRAEPCDMVGKIMEAVTHWSTAPELPDDMTVVIARGL